MGTTDSEDSSHLVVQKTAGTAPQPSQLAVVGGSYSSLSPMIIMNNVLLEQVHMKSLILSHLIIPVLIKPLSAFVSVKTEV